MFGIGCIVKFVPNTFHTKQNKLSYEIGEEFL